MHNWLTQGCYMLSAVPKKKFQLFLSICLEVEIPGTDQVPLIPATESLQIGPFRPVGFTLHMPRIWLSQDYLEPLGCVVCILQCAVLYRASWFLLHRSLGRFSLKVAMSVHLSVCLSSPNKTFLIVLAGTCWSKSIYQGVPDHPKVSPDDHCVVFKSARQFFWGGNHRKIWKIGFRSYIWNLAGK